MLHWSDKWVRTRKLMGSLRTSCLIFSEQMDIDLYNSALPDFRTDTFHSYRHTHYVKVLLLWIHTQRHIYIYNHENKHTLKKYTCKRVYAILIRIYTYIYIYIYIYIYKTWLVQSMALGGYQFLAVIEPSFTKQIIYIYI